MNRQEELFLKMLIDQLEDCADRSARCAASAKDADMWDCKIDNIKVEIMEFVERICND